MSPLGENAQNFLSMWEHKSKKISATKAEISIKLKRTTVSQSGSGHQLRKPNVRTINE